MESFIGMFQGLFGKLVPGQVIPFSVVRGGSTVGMGGKFVEFSGSSVRVIWHDVSILGSAVICCASRSYAGCPCPECFDARRRLAQIEYHVIFGFARSPNLSSHIETGRGFF
jgi:hypothetical protein